MNERIIELANEANKDIGYTFKMEEAKQLHELMEKFAELIVKECSKVIVNGGYRNPALGDKHPLTPPEIAQMIREHFGVEE
jgi:hypothetical protein